jgi:subtilisin family serine protease
LLAQQWALAKLGADQPWNVAPPGAGKTIVGIVDSGLYRADNTHPLHVDLGVVEPLLDCQPQPVLDGSGKVIFPGMHLDCIDQDGHGTLLAGTIAAVPGNGEGVSSAVQPSWNISLLPVKFFSPAAGPSASYAAIGIAHAVDKQAKVINASWHVPTGDTDLWMLRLALEFAARRNRLVVIAAGNDGSDNEIYPTYPANFGPLFPGNAMTVAASDRDDFKASYSNYGKNYVGIAAPGTAIVSTALYLANPPRYADYSGTSAATAFVSSAAALVFALNPPNWDGAGAQGWLPADVIQHLRASADTKDGLKLACRDGKRLHIGRAVYGPLSLTAPAGGTTLVVNVATDITWTVAYDNPKFTDVKVEFITTANARLPLGTVPIGDRKLSWTPLAVMAGWIRITPTTGNFPVRSGLILVAS